MGALVRTSVRHQDDQSVRSLGGWGPRSDQQRAIANVVGRALRGCGPVDPDSHNVAMLASGAAQESNLPTHGLHALADFEDREAHERSSYRTSPSLKYPIFRSAHTS
jgi:hypothetical protein